MPDVVRRAPVEHEIAGLQVGDRHVGRVVVLRLRRVRQPVAGVAPRPRREPRAVEGCQARRRRRRRASRALLGEVDGGRARRPTTGGGSADRSAVGEGANSDPALSDPGTPSARRRGSRPRRSIRARRAPGRRSAAIARWTPLGGLAEPPVSARRRVARARCRRPRRAAARAAACWRRRPAGPAAWAAWARRRPGVWSRPSRSGRRGGRRWRRCWTRWRRRTYVPRTAISLAEVGDEQRELPGGAAAACTTRWRGSLTRAWAADQLDAGLAELGLGGGQGGVDLLEADLRLVVGLSASLRRPDGRRHSAGPAGRRPGRWAVPTVSRTGVGRTATANGTRRRRPPARPR